MTVSFMADTADLDAQITDYHRLASRAECLSVDLVLRMATLAASQERLRMTLERSMENVCAAGQGFDDNRQPGP